MRYQITERGDEVEMHVSETGDRAARLLAAMHECQESRCGCPTTNTTGWMGWTFRLAMIRSL